MNRIVDHIRVPAGENWREVLYQHQMRGEVGQIERVAAQMSLQSHAIKLADPRVPQEKELIDMVADLCEARGIAHIPRIGVCQSEIPNAFSASGQAIVFSTNIKQIMEYDELKAIVGHELSHHRHTLRDGIVNAGLFAAGFEGMRVGANRFYTKLPELGGLLGMASENAFMWARRATGVVVGGALTTPWRRFMEVEADKEGAELTSPEHMKNAFLALDDRVSDMKEHHEDTPRSLVSRVVRFAMEPISVHPKTEDRIKHMEKLAAEQRGR